MPTDLPYDVNDRPEWVHACDLAVVAVDARHHPGQDRWFFDPRPYTDAVLAIALREQTATEWGSGAL